MGDIVNLNKYRKGQQRTGRKQLAAVNRQKFARPKAELVRLEADRARESEALDGHALDRARGAHALERALGDRTPARPEPAHQAPEESDDGPGDPGHDPHPDRPGGPRETD
ncbi:MAG: DUF4169 family protein [Rhodospirillaceae bacterium]|nr:DUF4169 family protein [Rhodospirillaceae bacterium]